MKLVQFKEEGCNFSEKSIMQKVWITCSPIQYLNFTNGKDAIFWSFIRFQYILHDPGALFSESWNFYKLRSGANFSEELILQKVWIIWSTVHYFKFKSFMGPESWSFIRFQKILHHSGVLLPGYWIFYKLKRREPISGDDQFWRKSELFGSPFCFSSVFEYQNL